VAGAGLPFRGLRPFPAQLLGVGEDGELLAELLQLVGGGLERLHRAGQAVGLHGGDAGQRLALAVDVAADDPQVAAGTGDEEHPEPHPEPEHGRQATAGNRGHAR
jgi:hypothetical protein